MFQKDGPTFRDLVVQALSSTVRGYDLLAPKFDKTPFRTPDEILEPMARLVGQPRSIERALDVCCGTGAAMRWLRPLCREEVVGIDFSPGMLDEARRSSASWPGDARVTLVHGDVLEMAFDAEFDVVTCVGAFGHILEEDEGRFLDRLRAALRPGGRFLFATAEMPPVWSRAWWTSRGFNAVMRARNALRKPEFVMYYLTFLWPAVRAKLEAHGFAVEAHRGLCPPPFEKMLLISATRREL